MTYEKRKRVILSIKRQRRDNSLNEINYKSIAAAGLIGLSNLVSPATALEKNPEEKSQQIKYPYTVEDILASTIIDEAGGERDAEKGMQAVLNVILKRGKGDIRKSAAECLKPKQFSGWNKVNKSDIKSINKFIDLKRKHPRYSLALKLVSQARNGTLSDITNGATHFDNLELTKSVSGRLPSWYDPRKVTAKIGNTTFLKLN